MSRRCVLILGGLAVLLGACSSGSMPPSAEIEGPMNGVEVVVGGTTDPTDRIMSGLILAALESRGAIVVDRSNTEGVALNRDDLVAGRLDVVPEDIGTGWFIHLGETEEFPTTTALATELRQRDRRNGIEWSDHSSFDDALVAVVDEEAATDDDGAPISVTQLARRLGNSFDAVVCVDRETLQSRDGLVRFERATGFTVPTEQLEVRDADELIDATGAGDCTVSFVPGVDPAIGAAGLVAVDRFERDGRTEVVFTPRNAAFMFDRDFYDEWSDWLSPLLESLMVTLDTPTMIGLKQQLLDGRDPIDIGRDHLESNELL